MNKWHTSSYSQNSGGNCVEVAEGTQEILVRDTMNREAGHLTFTTTEWSAFLHATREGEL